MPRTGQHGGERVEGGGSSPAHSTGVVDGRRLCVVVLRSTFGGAGGGVIVGGGGVVVREQRVVRRHGRQAAGSRGRRIALVVVAATAWALGVRGFLDGARVAAAAVGEDEIHAAGLEEAWAGEGRGERGCQDGICTKERQQLLQEGLAGSGGDGMEKRHGDMRAGGDTHLVFVWRVNVVPRAAITGAAGR